jgi:hypothetical protein
MFHDMLKDRPAADFHHRLWTLIRLLGKPHPIPPARIATFIQLIPDVAAILFTRQELGQFAGASAVILKRAKRRTKPAAPGFGVSHPER